MSEASADLSTIAGRLALASPTEGAGVVAAGVVELAAGLCESIARDSLQTWADGSGAAVQAATLRERSSEAATGNARAYDAARAALARAPEPGASGRDGNLFAALVAAADSLLTIATAGADCAALAAEIAQRCEPVLRADAAGAAELATAAARSASALIDVNLVLMPGDQRRERASAIVAGADAARARAREAAAST